VSIVDLVFGFGFGGVVSRSLLSRVRVLRGVVSELATCKIQVFSRQISGFPAESLKFDI
jgi:alpha/beta superfamily hydrolase